MQKNSYFGYKIVSNILKFVGNIWVGGKSIGKENIPKNEGCILAGNHTSNLDAYMLFISTKRPVHFIAKKELFDGKMAWFFRMMHLIPVDRKKKNPEAKKEAIDILNKDKVIGIFPEGTFRKKELLLPFKPGAISFAEKTGKPIIPFAIDKPLKFRSKSKIVFGKPIYFDKIKKEDKVKYLEEEVKKLLINIKKES